MSEAKPFLVAGQWRTGEGTFEVHNPVNGEVVAEVGKPTAEDIEDAMAAAAGVFDEARLLPIWARADALDQMSRMLADRRDEIAQLIALEGGKPIKWATVEATRASSTFRIAAETIRAGSDEIERFDTEQSLGSRVGIIRRFPYGPVLGITPFNFPVNLVAHKVAPAIAAGAPIVIKPASATPLGSLLLAELFMQTDLPKGMFQVVTVGGAQAEEMARDSRFAKISFTGSPAVGWHLRGVDPKKRVTLELGGNAGVIVHEDADLDHAAARIAFGGYYQAGQSCISVQRIFVQASVYDDFCDRLVKQVAQLKTGDTLDPATDVGPVIDAGSLERIDEWVKEAVAGGAKVLIGGERKDPYYLPTVLSETRAEDKVRCEEVFGPVTTVMPYGTFEEAIDEVNDSKYGLQAGVFTNDINRAFQAHRDLEVGGVIINDQSAFRADQQPYGGAKDSGMGREGLKYAIEEMTDPRIMVLSHIPL